MKGVTTRKRKETTTLSLHLIYGRQMQRQTVFFSVVPALSECLWLFAWKPVLFSFTGLTHTQGRDHLLLIRPAFHVPCAPPGLPMPVAFQLLSQKANSLVCACPAGWHASGPASSRALLQPSLSQSCLKSRLTHFVHTHVPRRGGGSIAITFALHVIVAIGRLVDLVSFAKLLRFHWRACRQT